MKKIEKPSAIFKWRGQLATTIGLAYDKVIEFTTEEPCPHCGKNITVLHAEVESSPNFQSDAEAINTLEDN